MPPFMQQSFNFNGKTIYHSSEARFIVEVTRTKHPKSNYREKHSVASPAAAFGWYVGTNIGNGFKKRLVMVEGDGKRTVLTRTK